MIITESFNGSSWVTKTILLFGLVFSNSLCASGVGADIATTVSALNAASISKNLANPIANMVAVPIQYNYNRGIGLNSAGKVQSVTLQPVIPIGLSGGKNLILRPIITAETQNNVNGFSGSGVGNVQLETFYVPNLNSSLIWGVGPYLISPAGGSGQFGSTQTGAGISAVGLKQIGPWTAGLLAVQSWAVSGSKTYGTVNSFYYQPFVSYRTSDNWTYAVDTESTFNYDARRTSNQFVASVSKLIMAGDQPISLSVGPKYNVSAVPGGPQGWGARATVTLIFTK